MARPEDAPIRVLHVDDDPDFVEVIGARMERENEQFDVLTVTSGAAGLEHLESDSSVECVVSDYEMPEMDGLEFLREARERYGDLPFILYTGKGSEEIASEAISAGVTEYLQKDTSEEQYEVLAHRIERAVAQQRAWTALAESDRMFSTLVENLSGVVYRAEMATGWPMEFVSEGCLELTGYGADALESGEVSWGEDVIHPDDRADVWETIESSIEEDESFTLSYRIVTRDGETRWVWERGSAVFRDDDLEFLEGFIADITDERRRREALREERAVTEMAIDALDDAFFVTDTETGAFLRWNDRLAGFTGYSDEELAELTVFDLLPEEDRETIYEAADRLMTGEEITVDTEAVRSDGEHVPIEVRSSPIYDDDGELVGIGTIARDVTERREREQRLERFAGVVSHDLRNPLHVVQSRIELALETGDFEHLEAATAATERMDAMIDDLLALTLEGETVGETEPIDLAVLAREAWQSVETGPASLAIDDPGTVDADRTRLHDVFANLFRNAIDHTDRDPASLTLKQAIDRADGSEEPTPMRVRVGGLEGGFFVEDDGPGIPPEEREAVFDHGYSTSESGSGLGLAIVDSIVEAHGWMVTVTESEWGGARFEFST